jgi:hypothetical protein
MAKIFPQQMGAALPMLIRQQDWPGKDGLAAQIEKTLPEELRQPDPNKPKDDPEQLKAVIAQMSGQIQTLSKLVTEATDKHNSEERNQEWETFRTQMVQETQLAINAMKVGSQEAQFLNQQIFAELQRVREMLAPKTVESDGSTKSSAPSGAPAAPAAPVAPQPSSTPPPGGEATPAEVGIGT